MLGTKNTFSHRKKIVVHSGKSAGMGTHKARQPVMKLKSGPKDAHLGYGA